jgi:uncharacterized protein (DUF58 family)
MSRSGRGRKKSPLKSRRIFKKRTLWPTPEGTRYLLLMFGVLLAAVNTGNNLIYLLLAMMLSLMILSGILSEQSLRHVIIRHRFPRHIFAGVPFSLKIRLENRKHYFSSFSLRLRESWAKPVPESYFSKIGPGSIATHRLTLTFRRRGRYRLSGTRLSTTFPFGLFLKTRFPSLVDEILVYPQIDPLPSTLLSGRPSLDPGREPSKGTGSIYRNLRDYRMGDDSRAIHWKTTARQRRLIIRENEMESGNRVTLIFANLRASGIGVSGLRNGRRENQGPGAIGRGLVTALRTGLRSAAGDAPPPIDEAFEKAVRLAASIAALWIKEGASVRFISAQEIIPFGAGSDHLHRILKLLALIAPCDLPTRSVPRIAETAYLILPHPEPEEVDWPGRGPWQVIRPGEYDSFSGLFEETPS